MCERALTHLLRTIGGSVSPFPALGGPIGTVRETDGSRELFVGTTPLTSPFGGCDPHRTDWSLFDALD